VVSRGQLGGAVVLVGAIGLLAHLEVRASAEAADLKALRAQIAAQTWTPTPLVAAPEQAAARPPVLRPMVDSDTVNAVARAVVQLEGQRAAAAEAEGVARKAAEAQPARTLEQEQAVTHATEATTSAIGHGRLSRDDVLRVRRDLEAGQATTTERDALRSQIAMAINSHDQQPEARTGGSPLHLSVTGDADHDPCPVRPLGVRRAEAAAPGACVDAAATVVAMLAYVFWHWPAVDHGYEAALLEFHHVLAVHPPPGFHGSRVARIGPRAWLSVQRAYEDWYFVADFTALGALNEAAISGRRKGPHDLVAALPAGGTAALYGHVRGSVRRPRHASFRSKPSAESYVDYLAGLPAGVEAWQRKMVLGPAPEFCLVSEQALADSTEFEVLYCQR
jgi:hypothetical protein